MGKRLAEIFRENSSYKAFFISIIITGLSYGIYKGMIDNYLAEIVTMGEFDRGLAEFFREIPGLLLVFILAAFYTFSAERMYKIGAVIMLLGMGILLSANEVPRIAQQFGLDSSVKVNMMSVVHATTTAVNLTRSVARAVK